MLSSILFQNGHIGVALSENGGLELEWMLWSVWWLMRQIDTLKAESNTKCSECVHWLLDCWTGYKSTVMGALFRIII